MESISGHDRWKQDDGEDGVVHFPGCPKHPFYPKIWDKCGGVNACHCFPLNRNGSYSLYSRFLKWWRGPDYCMVRETECDCSAIKYDLDESKAEERADRELDRHRDTDDGGDTYYDNFVDGQGY